MPECEKLFDSRTPSTKQTYAAAVSRPSTTRSVECQTDMTWTHTDHPLTKTTTFDSPTNHSVSLCEMSLTSQTVTKAKAQHPPTPEIPAPDTPPTDIQKQIRKQNPGKSQPRSPLSLKCL